MEISKEQAEQLIQSFAHIRMRHSMYFSNDVPAVQNWLYGFEAACRLLNAHIRDQESDLWTERGWNAGAMHPIGKMIEKGLSEDEVITEVFTVLILALQRKYNVGNEPIMQVHNLIRESAVKTLADTANPVGEFNIHRKVVISQSVREQAEAILNKLDNIEKDMSVGKQEDN